MPNPLFPLDEYVPDGEPHVFGDRVYLYGSHDRENGDRFCMRDYTVYSAPVSDLSRWTCHGVTYRRMQDPRSTPQKPVDLYAPDCVQGPDGRYYLYYAAMGPNVRSFGPMSVAVAERPEGPFEYLADIHYPDGTPLMRYLTNDPAVLNDSGRIWLYYGWGLGRDFRNRLLAPVYDAVQSRLFQRTVKEIRETKPSILSCAVTELCSDMVTVKAGPKAVLDSKTTAEKGSELYAHAFYEAPSIRKFGDLYYLLYSSGENCELACATSRYPDRDFVYRGVVISNADLGYRGNRNYHISAGTIHGGIEKINGQYYVFYHRCTNNTDFSRQACCERISVDETGRIAQAEVTTQGAEEALEAKRKWQAAQCCNLYNGRTRRVMGNGHNHDVPTIVRIDGSSFVTAIDRGTVIGYKYLNFDAVREIRITCRGAGGTMYVATSDDRLSCLLRDLKNRKRHAEREAAPDGAVSFPESADWQTFTEPLLLSARNVPLYFVYEGRGKTEFLNFEFR